MLTQANEMQLVRCTTGDVAVGMDVRHITAVERGDRLARQPASGAPGVFRSRDGEWPVFNLSGTPGDRPEGHGHVVLFVGPNGRVGLLVDRVSPVERVSYDAVTPAPAGLGGDWAREFSGVARMASGPLAILATGDFQGAGRDTSAVTVTASRAPRDGRPFAPNRLLTFSRTECPGPGGRGTFIGVPVEAVAEVYDAEPGTRVPGAADHAREMIVWRNRPLVLVDALRWVGLPPAGTVTRRVVVIRTGSGVIGVPAGPVVQILPASTPCVTSRRNLPIHRSHVASALDTSDQTIVVPDWSRLESGRPDAWTFCRERNGNATD